MPLQDSPSLKDIKNGYKAPPDPGKSINRTRAILVVVILLLLVLTGISFMGSDLAASKARNGSITGFAVNEAGNPVQVEVMVFGTDNWILSGENGYFEIPHAPVGEQSVIVAYDKIATEVDVLVDPGAENLLGMVTVPTELLIFVDE